MEAPPFILEAPLIQLLLLQPAARLPPPLVDPLGGLGLGQPLGGLDAGLVRERLQVGGLRAGHRLVARGPLLGVLDRLRPAAPRLLVLLHNQTPLWRYSVSAEGTRRVWPNCHVNATIS